MYLVKNSRFKIMDKPYICLETNKLLEYGYIYMTVNTISNKKYIGRRHQRLARYDNSYKGSSKELQEDIKKYGTEIFEKFIITEGNYSNTLLGELEKHYIQLYNAANNESFYNISSGGDYDLKCAVENATFKKRTLVYEFDENQNIINVYDSNVKAYTKLKIAENTLQKALKYGTKVRKTNSFFSKIPVFPTCLITNNYKIPVYLYDNLGSFVKEFDSKTACAKYLNISVSEVSRACNHNTLCQKLWAIRTTKEEFVKIKKAGKPVIIKDYSNSIIFNSLKECSEFMKNKYNLKGNVSSHLIKSIKNNIPYKNYFIEYYEN